MPTEADNTTKTRLCDCAFWPVMGNGERHKPISILLSHAGKHPHLGKTATAGEHIHMSMRVLLDGLRRRVERISEGPAFAAVGTAAELAALELAICVIEDVEPDELSVAQQRWGRKEERKRTSTRSDGCEHDLCAFGDGATGMKAAALKVRGGISRGTMWEEISLSAEADALAVFEGLRDSYNQAWLGRLSEALLDAPSTPRRVEEQGGWRGTVLRPETSPTEAAEALKAMLPEETLAELERLLGRKEWRSL